MNEPGLLKEDEVLEDIIWDNYSLIQKKRGFKFGIDAYLLADFVRLRPNERVIDLGTGTGIISFLLRAKKRNITVTALDIIPEMIDMVNRSIALNNISNIKTLNCDLRQAPQILGRGLFSLVVSNPPYFPVEAGEHSPDINRAIARTELKCSLEDLITSAAQLLNYGGRFIFIHRPSRLAEIFTTLQQQSLEPKRMRLVFPYPGEEPNLVLIEARKNAGKELRILPPMFVYSTPGQYSEEVNEFFQTHRK